MNRNPAADRHRQAHLDRVAAGTTYCHASPYVDRQHRWYTDTERGGMTCTHCDAHLDGTQPEVKA